MTNIKTFLYYECQLCGWRSSKSQDKTILSNLYESHFIKKHLIFPVLHEEGIDFDENGDDLD